MPLKIIIGSILFAFAGQVASASYSRVFKDIMKSKSPEQMEVRVNKIVAPRITTDKLDYLNAVLEYVDEKKFPINTIMAQGFNQLSKLESTAVLEKLQELMAKTNSDDVKVGIAVILSNYAHFQEDALEVLASYLKDDNTSAQIKVLIASQAMLSSFVSETLWETRHGVILLSLLQNNPAHFEIWLEMFNQKRLLPHQKTWKNTIVFLLKLQMMDELRDYKGKIEGLLQFLEAQDKYKFDEAVVAYNMATQPNQCLFVSDFLGWPPPMKP